MAELSYFWNGITTGDAGPYSDSEYGLQSASMQTGATYGHYNGSVVNQWNAGGIVYGSGLFDDVTSQKDGTLGAYLNGIPVNAGGAGNLFVFLRGSSGATYDIGVTTGAAYCSTGTSPISDRFGVLYYNTAVYLISLAANGTGNSRIDVVYINVDTTAQTARIAVLQGTPAATPVPPDAGENVLAYVTVPPGGMTAQTDIKQAGTGVNMAQAVIVPNVINNSGARLHTGDVVSWATGSGTFIEASTGGGGATRRVYQMSVTLCAANDPNVAGIWLGRSEDWAAISTTQESVGAVLTHGIGFARITTMPGAAQTGSELTTAASGLCAIAAVGERVRLGRVLQTGTSGRLSAYGFVLVALNIRNLAPAASRAVLGGDRTTTSATYVDLTDASITLTTTGGRVALGFNGASFNSGANANAFSFSIDGAAEVGPAAEGLYRLTGTTAAGVAMTYLTDALSAGSHTFKVRWKTSGGTATARADSAFWAQETV